MTEDAVAVMAGLRERLFNLEQASGGLASGFQSFIGKLRGLGRKSRAHLAHGAQSTRRRRHRFDQ